MFNTKDWGIPLLMLGFTLLGFILATSYLRQSYTQQLDEQRIKYQLATVKKHMTTILQLNDCYINEAFFTLDREIFETKKAFERDVDSAALRAANRKANTYITDYYLRFNMRAECDDCVPRSPMPKFHCTAA